jgi:hypothetical protein
MARQHQLMISGAPHPHLGNISSPRHEDCPLVWKEWTQHIVKVIPKGLAIGPDGSAFKRHIRGFRRLAPFFRDRSKKKAATTEAGAEEASAQPTGRTHQKMGQIIMLTIVALDGYYTDPLTRLPAGSLSSSRPKWTRRNVLDISLREVSVLWRPTMRVITRLRG